MYLLFGISKDSRSYGVYYKSKLLGPLTFLSGILFLVKDSMYP